ncbi:peroxidase 17 [Quercus suber]|uniref:peroxidase n=1 Tax=Quercus suber TaxID=58331 RepID=A0AAW0MBF9_QUESU
MPTKLTKLEHFTDPPTSAQIMSPFFQLFLLHITMAAAAQLRPDFYSQTCPNAEFIVRDVMIKALIREPRSVASVMRLQFHDCLVNGCDASVLLDDTPTIPGEKQALSNINSLRSFETGGPDWKVSLGRLDSLTPKLEESNEIMPSPRSNASYLIDLFKKFNLSVKDLVALSGTHSIGQHVVFPSCFDFITNLGLANLTLPLNQSLERS